MPTTVTKTIGTGGDYATIALWEDGEDNTSLVSADEVRVGALLNETHVVDSPVTIGGATVDATRYRVLKCASGASFRDHANVKTNALRYNSSNGAAISYTIGFSAALFAQENYVHFEGLQISAVGGALAALSATTGVQVDFCIIEGTANGGPLQVDDQGFLIRNSLIVQRTSGAACIATFAFAAGNCVNCTFVTPSDLTAATDAIAAGNGTKTFKNCAFFGASNIHADGTPTFTTCYANDASPPTGVTTATYANQFENTLDSTRDFRVKSGANLIDTGTTDTTNAAIDIAKTSRPNGSAYDVGAWEFGAPGQLSGIASASGVGTAFPGITIEL